MTTQSPQKLQDYQVFATGSEAKTISGETISSPQQLCKLLESGGVIYFPQSPLLLAQSDIDFLREQKQLAAGYHKNIAYKPLIQKLSGVEPNSGTDTEQLKEILHGYCEKATHLVESVLSPYQGNIHLDYTSFRPMEEDGRKLRLRARNDLLHVDSFPTRATHGNRILRVFTNVSPSKTRVWNTSKTFSELVEEFKSQVKPFSKSNLPASKTIQKLGKLMGIKNLYRPAYDRWMMDFHNFLKENTVFQATCPKSLWEFPPGSSWMVYTDTVSHAVLSGQHAIEQTFMIDLQGMVLPEAAPLRILERTYTRS